MKRVSKVLNRKNIKQAASTLEFKVTYYVVLFNLNNSFDDEIFGMISCL